MLEEKNYQNRTNKIKFYFPEEGPYRRELYFKHMDFFKAGKTVRERCALSANRVGKTESLGGYEDVLHATGEYPDWWPGRRFDRPPLIWVAGDTGKTVRDILQAKILGPIGDFGTGLIPKDKIEGTPRPKQGVSDAVEIVNVKHKSGGISVIHFKSYDQRREAFQGNEPDVIHLDEESPDDIYFECVTRTMTNNGMLMVTYTPLMGLTPTVLLFAPSGDVIEGINKDTGRYVTNITWDDVPHLSEKMKYELLMSFPPYMRDARSRGIPQLGSGAIYPIPESDVTIADFDIPQHWRKVYALDVGWNFTACVWGAIDDVTNTTYIYAVYKRSQAEPSVHASAIKAKGEWISGVIDPASRGRSQRDGKALIDDYKDLGLNLIPAENSVEAGIQKCWEMLSNGQLKIFASCGPFFQEYRIYRRDEKGRIVKSNDHLMDAKRYLIMSGLDIAQTKPTKVLNPISEFEDYGYMKTIKNQFNPQPKKSGLL